MAVVQKGVVMGYCGGVEVVQSREGVVLREWEGFGKMVWQDGKARAARMA